MQEGAPPCGSSAHVHTYLPPLSAAPAELAGLPEALPAVQDAPDLELVRQEARGAVMEELRKEADEGMRAFIAATQVRGRGGPGGMRCGLQHQGGCWQDATYSCFSLVRRRP